MTFAERLIVEANKTAFKVAKKEGKFAEALAAAIAEDRETRIAYLLDNKIVTLEEINSIISE